jgi:hypothetical protein
MVKDKKSILEKFGLVEKVPVENEHDFNESGQEVLTEVEKAHVEKVHNADIKIEVNNTFEQEDPTVEMRNKRLSRAEEIYEKYNINNQGINSLFIVENFLKALPGYLPIDVKRESMLNIISSSGVKVENLTSDGNDRLKCLNDFSQSFSYNAKDSISRCESEIKKLSEKVNSYKKAIDGMKELQEEQEAVVRYEVERINNILQFISPQR